MNLGFVTSFLVSGILMISIVSLNTRMAESSADLTMRYIIEERAQTIEQMVDNDFPRIGNDVHTTINSPIEDARENLIKFKSNLDNSGDVETVVWKYTDNEVEGSQNPDDYVLYREVDGVSKTFARGVTDFTITYVDGQQDTLSYSNLTAAGEADVDEEDGDGGSNQSNRDEISYIIVKFSVETEQKIGGAGASDAAYLETNWKKKYPVYNQINQ